MDQTVDFNIMVETWKRLDKIFPKYPKYLLLRRFAETGNHELILYIDVPSSVPYEDMKTAMDKFDEEYWIDACSNAGFTIIWEWVD